MFSRLGSSAAGVAGNQGLKSTSGIGSRSIQRKRPPGRDKGGLEKHGDREAGGRENKGAPHPRSQILVPCLQLGKYDKWHGPVGRRSCALIHVSDRKLKTETALLFVSLINILLGLIVL